MKFLIDNPIGLYLHIPFCKKKCAYCDFYSACVTEKLKAEYLKALCTSVEEWGGKINRPVDTVYFGGGTPSLLGENLIPLAGAVRSSFDLSGKAEITLELNPDQGTEAVLLSARKAGINRLSVGVQSGIDSELSLLGRTHTAAQSTEAIFTARRLGFKNISVDLMCALPGSSLESIEQSLNFITRYQPEHISVYILKIEENTLFHKKRAELNIPDDDAAAEQYIYICEYLKARGYRHYEISNFALPGFESRHNLKYWHCEEYLGLWAAAHSFLNGKRFFFPRSIKSFLNGESPLPDGNGGDIREYLMLGLRLSDGIRFSEYRSRFGSEPPQSFLKAAERLSDTEFLKLSDNGVALTESGMLLSNTLITELLENVE